MPEVPTPRRSEPTWRPAAPVLVVAAAFLGAVALYERNPLPLLLAIPLLLAPVGSALDAPAGPSSGQLRWRAEGIGSEVTIRGELLPEPPVGPAQLDITFFRPEVLREVSPPRAVPRAGRLEFTLEWRATAPCLTTVPLPRALWRDDLGLLEKPVAVAGDALRVERFPPEVMRLGTVRLRRTTLQPGEVRSKAVGGAGEFFAIRASGPSDTPRQINWRATSRVGRLLANDFLLERTGDLLLLLDLRPTTLGPERDRQLLAIAQAGSLGIATGFLGEKSRVGLGLFGEFLTAVPLGAGRRQRHRLRAALQAAQITSVPGPSERFAVSLRRYFPPGVTTVLISPLAEESDVVLLTHLRRRGYPTIVLSPSPLPLLEPPPGSSTSDDALAMRLLRLVRRDRVSRAWPEAPVVEWTDYWSLAPFVRFLARPIRNPTGAR